MYRLPYAVQQIEIHSFGRRYVWATDRMVVGGIVHPTQDLIWENKRKIAGNAITYNEI